MDKLISDKDQVEISIKVKDVLRHLCIDDWQYEPNYQHQNYSERRLQAVKTITNRVLNKNGAPGNTWMFFLKYVCFIMNRVSMESLGWRTPYEKLNCVTPDISMIYRFRFWNKVYLKEIKLKVDHSPLIQMKLRVVLLFFQSLLDTR